MDDQQAYLLSGLLNRHFGLGRVVRFRPVQRGRQAEAFELFTAQEREYLLQLYLPAFEVEQLEFAATTVTALDAQRFSTMPFLKSKGGTFVVEGPQNRHMLVSLAPAGSALAAADYTEHDISQVGLRLAWMHRLLGEHLRDAPTGVPLAERVQGLVPEPVLSLVDLMVPLGWVHGDVRLTALLHDADHQLRAVTDWGLLHYGCPLEDLVDAFLALARLENGALDSERGRALLEAYDTLIPIKGIPWTPVVAHWCAQRMLDAAAHRREMPEGLEKGVLPEPERLATAMAGCI